MKSGPGAQTLAFLGRLRWWQWTLVALGVLCLVVALVRQPLARYAANRTLAGLKGWKGEVRDVHVGFFPLVYTVNELNLVPEDPSLPILYVERIDTGLFWGDLLRGHIRGWANLEHVKLTFFLIPIVVPDIAAMLGQIMPLAISRMQFKRSEVTVALRHNRSDVAAKPEGSGPVIWFHDIEATMEGLATRPELAKQASTFALHAAVAHSGTLSVLVTIDLLAQPLLSFAGQIELRGLNLSDLDALLQPEGLKIAGTFDLLARLGCEKGQLTGALQPLLKNGHVESIGPDWGNKLKAAIADGGVELLSDRVPGRNAVSTIIPVHGNLNRPKVDVWSALAGVMRNAFVVGLSESLQQLPAGTPAPGSPPPSSAGAHP